MHSEKCKLTKLRVAGCVLEDQIENNAIKKHPLQLYCYHRNIIFVEQL